MFQDDSWQEEMINNRKKSIVVDMRWTNDGQQICIVYEDGAVIVGSVGGDRLWAKELGVSLHKTEWSPDGRYILFATQSGELLVYGARGHALVSC